MWLRRTPRVCIRESMQTSHEKFPRGHDEGEETRLIATSELARRLEVASDTIR